MSYRLIQTPQGTFSIDWDVCCQIMRSRNRALLQAKHSRPRPESQDSFQNRLSRDMPNLTYLEVDWDLVRMGTQGETMMQALKHAGLLLYDSKGVDQLVYFLQQCQSETRSYHREFREKQKRASDESQRSIEESIAKYGDSIAAATLVRELANFVLVLAATVTTGGAGLAAAGGSAVLKTVSTYQNTFSVGATVIEASQNIICTVIPMARGKELGNVVKILIGTSADTGKALFEGHEIGTALQVGAVNIPVGVGGAAIKGPLAKALGKTAASLVVKASQEVAKKTAQSAIKQNAIAGARMANTQQWNVPPLRAGSLADRISFEDDLLLKLAVIDMSRGIGRSWW